MRQIHRTTMNDQQQLLIVQFLQLCAQLLNLVTLYARVLTESSNRRWWVRPVNSEDNRRSTGFHVTYFRELMNTDHEVFFGWTRMWPYQFRNLYELVRPRLLKRSRRRSLHPELRLVLTLSYLAHGDSMFSKKAEFRIGRSTAYQIVPEVCRIIWDVLQPHYLAQPTQELWQSIADEFMHKWQFPNCIGALDGKHIRIQCPPHSGSQYSNYKKYFSLVLMAVCDANYKFILVDIGQFGSISDGGVWTHSDMSHLLSNNLLDVPPKKELPGTLIATDYALVADEAFPLKTYLLRPYPRHQLSDKERVFNYRLSRARRVIENAFGILVSRWRILTRPICCSPDNAEHLVKALICLHNFVMTGEREIAPAHRRYCPPRLIDREVAEGMLLEGAWRGHGEQGDLVQNIGRLSSNNANAAARAQRDVLRDYFITKVGEAQVPWQYQQAFRGYNIDLPDFHES